MLRKPKSQDVFISYAHKDKELALKLVELLKARGFSCWCDVEGLYGGVDYEKEILEGIRNASVVIPLLSEAALDSKYVRYEIGAARGVGKPVVQVMLQPLPIQSLTEPFSTREQIVDLSAGIAEGPVFDRLVKDLEVWTTAARGKRNLKLAALLVALVLMFFGLRQLLSYTPLGNLLVKGAPPMTGSLSLTSSAHASEYSGPTAYDQTGAPAAATDNGSFHPQIAFGVFGLSNGATNWVPLAAGSALHSGEHFFIRAETFTPGYLYVFLVDSSGKLQWLFPANQTSPYSFGSNSVPAHVVLALPPDDHQAYRLDDTTGEERVFAIYSASRWDKLEEALTSAGDTNSPNGNRDVVSLLAVTDALTDRAKGIAAVETTHVVRDVHQSTAAEQDGLLVALPAQSTRAKGNWLLEVRRFEHLPAAAK